jgi:hypothetical protein
MSAPRHCDETKYDVSAESVRAFDKMACRSFSLRNNISSHFSMRYQGASVSKPPTTPDGGLDAAAPWQHNQQARFADISFL